MLDYRSSILAALRCLKLMSHAKRRGSFVLQLHARRAGVHNQSLSSLAALCYA